MEKESFEDHEVAEILNNNFISIKIDREERPDIDAVYMSAVQAMTGSGGWPMTVFLDHENNPFYAGTYFPRDSGRYGLGFIPLLLNISESWKKDRDKLMDAGREMTSHINSSINTGKAIRGKNHSVDMNTAETGFRQFQNIFDSEYGGFGNAPKFPSPHNIIFLLRYYKSTGSSKALEMAEKTLTSMYRGGIYDHIGGGFSRYSTDRIWLVPHFEKMIYDNAMLAMAYTEGYLCTKNEFYRTVADDILNYVKRDMMSEEGGFYSAEDADSEGMEGKFYIFSPKEITDVLGDKDGKEFCRKFNITPKGNFEGKNIPNLINSGELNEIITSSKIIDCKNKLFLYREKRIHPFKDKKIITSWNGLMIAALAYCGRHLSPGNPYIEMGENCAEFIDKNLTDQNGYLFTRYKDKEAKFNGVADDYACMVMGLLELYQSTLKKEYLLRAYRYNQVLVNDFWADGSVYQTGKNSEKLIMRSREIYDGALPSYNSMCISNFYKLSHLCDDKLLGEMAEDILNTFGKEINAAAYAHSYALNGILQINNFTQVVIKGDTAGLRNAVDSLYNPFTSIAHADSLQADINFYKNYLNSDDAAYVCKGRHCSAPVYNEDDLKNLLEN